MEDNKKEKVAVVSFLKKLKHDLLRYVIVFVVALVGSILVILPVPRYYKCDISLAPEMDNTENGGKLSSIASSFGVDLGDVASANAFLMQGGQKVITLHGQSTTYYIGNAFNIDENRGTGTGTSAYNLITFSISDNGDISASLCGPLFLISNGQPQYTGLTTERIILWAYTGEPFTSENLAGLWDQWMNPVMKKSASSSPAKPSVLPEESFDNTASMLMPQYAPNRVARFDVDWNSFITTSIASQVKINK